MATIVFSSERAEQRFNRCKSETERAGDHSLLDCIESLKRWSAPYIRIGCDFDEMSFTFSEELDSEARAAGRRPVNGGIIYHGPRDGCGSGEAPTFSVTLDRADGYRIHT